MHTVKESISGSPVYTNGHFCVEPCVTCFVPGYLLVTPQLSAASLSELGRDALASLGPTLAAVTRAIEVVVRPERVYCTLFAEETRSVHFHLFPRSVWLVAAASVGPKEASTSLSSSESECKSGRLCTPATLKCFAPCVRVETSNETQAQPRLRRTQVAAG